MDLSLKVVSNFRIYLKKNFPSLFTYILNNDLFLKISFTKLFKIFCFLNKHSLAQYKVLSDICVIDYPWRKTRFEVFYNVLSVRYNSRISLFFKFDELVSLDSIIKLYKAADWFEREIWDLFGIFFADHPDLRRILTDYGFKGHPLRKDFPVSGYIEVRYFFNDKRILIEEVSLSQDIKTFFFSNSWNLL